MATIHEESDIESISCPGCKAKIELERKKPVHRIVDKSADLAVTEFDAIVERVAAKLKPKEPEKAPEKPKKEVEVRLPSWQPKEFCADGSCGAEHKNKHYKQRPAKRCANGSCGQFAPAKAAKCAWCGSKDLDPEDRFEELDEDTLELLPMPESEAHEHHHDHEGE